jgi:deoxyribodipyrimidine photo-lyase
MNIVWYKRDLRIHDHAPLRAACAAGEALALFIVEPSLWRCPDAAPQHFYFLQECLAELKTELRVLNIELVVRVGEACDVFAKLKAEHTELKLFSHEETGNGASYARDRAVLAWARTNHIEWHESPSNAVVRRLRSRDEWSRLWMERMQHEPLAFPAAQPSFTPRLSDPFPSAEALGIQGTDKTARQRGGRSHALALLVSFLRGRGARYRVQMSSPLSAEKACSRLSTYLAFGSVSVREVVSEVWRARAHWKAQPADSVPTMLLQSLASFESRLHWHCHFIQKLETEPRIEFRNVHSGFDGLRNEGELSALEQQRFDAWCAAKTGFPMVDACMRMLHATGWVNFRMRAMLVSFASYQLWLHWRPTSLYLAREFLDYEPGIHYTQFQMQSGVTGINTVRMYNVVKQARDHDAQGAFVKRWLPELAKVPTEFIFEPWTMPETLQAHCGCVIGQLYPAPIVDQTLAMRAAKERIYALRGDTAVKAAAKAVFTKHGSRNPNREGKVRSKKTNSAPESTPQLSLF